MKNNKNSNAIDPKKLANKNNVDVSTVRRIVIVAQHDDRFGQGKPLKY